MIYKAVVEDKLVSDLKRRKEQAVYQMKMGDVFLTHAKQGLELGK